ncbi:pitrilysin family protein [Chelatococcus sp. SYSU_G07232]|uniref:Pitrilysin family protein n=1 Tax=Chelatococcus albus TaxID=3047466 RepID=A0ABT7AET5_9HYPH|nr:pitrilysin family protein [Chelatococcus sp. SYSU_G07232]MDJ1157880.1 pitrilysin family protein [Chelatococcus sp. SYSU_G07232]
MIDFPAVAGLKAGVAAAAGEAEGPTVTTFTLGNGLDVVVIPDRRVPVATHMVWYRNGSGDDPQTKSGIAHFLEHLMFKGTERHPAGEFSKIVASLGGQENAFTSYDYTAYFQRVAKEHLGTMMAFEADRMTGLVLDDAVVDPERDVVLEERRMRVDTDPSAQLAEAMAAALYVHHPYGTPIIGWMHEIEGLRRDDALAYYRRFYTPENAILVVAGDVEAEGVRRLAEDTYGRIAPRGARPERHRPREPEIRAMRRVSVADAKVEQPLLQRAWLVPSSRTQADGEAYALELLAEILGGGQTSVLYRTLVLEKELAVGAGAYYFSTMLDDARFGMHAAPRPGVSLETLEAAIDETVAAFVARGVSANELTRAKTRAVADIIYAQDSQAHLARLYGSALAIGETVEDVAAWPTRIEAVTADAVYEAATRFLDRRRAVTGYLLPDSP